MGKKMGEVEDSLKSELQQKKNDFEQKLAASDAELRKLWAQWDELIDKEGQPGAAVPNDLARAKTRDAMVALLNRRKYIANLVRDVNAELES